MSAFRDDRDLLKQRIEELEVALARAESRADKSALVSQVDSLVERVAAKRADLDADKKALADLAAALDSMARQLRPPPAAAEPAPAPGDATGRRRGWATLGLGVSVLAIAAGAFLLLAGGGNEPRAPVLQGGAERLDGWPSHLDPVALLPQMRGRVGRGDAVELGAIEVRYLAATGKLDITGKGYTPTLTYQFVQHPPPPAETARPLGVPPPPRAPSIEHTVTLDRTGVVTATDVMAMLAPPAVSPPRCTTTQVWAAAMAAGAPDHALATVRYRLASSGKPQWTFEIPQTDIRFEIDDGSCSVVERP